MARIPDAELEQIKERVAIARLAEARGVELRRVGHDLRGRCPFHADEEPSLSIDPQRNVVHCFGCGAKGTVIDWVMKAEGVSFRHAVELLRCDAALLPSGRESQGKGGSPRKVSTVRKLEAPVELEASDQELLEQVVSYYHRTLLESPPALEYLRGRGLDDGELVRTFRLGYANRTLGYRLPQKNRAAGAVVRGRLQELGIYRRTGHEHMSGCVVWPTCDEEGRVVGLYGRKITATLGKGIAKHLYLPGPRRGVWNWQALRSSEEVILCESHIDAATFWCAGYRHVTTAWGCRGLTEEHVEALRRHGVRRVVIAFDRDEGGEEGAREAAEKLLAAGLGCYRVEFPRGMDANEYALKVAPAAKSLGLALRHAVWLGKGDPPARAEPDVELRPSAGTIEPAEVCELETLEPTTAEASTSPATPTIEPSAPPSPKLEAAPPAMPDPPSLPFLAAASPEPPRQAAPAVPAEVRSQEVVIRLGDRRFRVRGLERNLSYELLKVNVLVARGEAFHVDTLDLYSSRARVSFVKQAAAELGLEEAVLKDDLAKVFLKLEELQEEQINQALRPSERPEVQLSEAEQEVALELLRSPELLSRIVADLSRCGLVGEDTNKLVCYLAAVSRKLERPLAVLVQSSSAAGKSTLMDTILELVPGEERVAYSAMTGQALFYMSEVDLRHKVLAIAEEEGAERASYALKLLQSEGELCIASTGKDPTTGRLVTQEYRVEGPVAIFSTTTAIDLDEELLNRCLILAVDESREQTRAIHRYQRRSRTLAGLFEREERKALRALHQNAQRLLRPLAVANPYAERLSYLDESTRTRRDHEKYLTLIDAIALLHQHQRPIRTGEQGGRVCQYVEVELSDIEAAHALAHEVLGRSLDELPPQTRRLLELVYATVTRSCERLAMKREHYRFTRREVREATSWGDTQLKVHLARLVELEYLLVHEGGRGKPQVYELVWDGEGQDGRPFLAGLVDPATLTEHAYDAKRSGQSDERSGSGRPLVGPRSGGGRGEEIAPELNNGNGLRATAAARTANARCGLEERQPIVDVALAVAGSPQRG